METIHDSVRELASQLIAVEKTPYKGFRSDRLAAQLQPQIKKYIAHKADQIELAMSDLSRINASLGDPAELAKAIATLIGRDIHPFVFVSARERWTKIYGHDPMEPAPAKPRRPAPARSERYVPSDAALEAQTIVGKRDKDAALAMLYKLLRNRSI